jgi:3',5'-cyclic-AMP phosphodiesterase
LHSTNAARGSDLKAIVVQRICYKCDVIVAQLSDPHISDLKPENTLALGRAVQHLNELPAKLDAVLITGDLTDNGTPSEYKLCLELLRALPVPFFVIPGNHDHRENLLEVFGSQGTDGMQNFVQYVVDLGTLQLIALDTHIPAQDAGLLCEARLKWLDERLSGTPERPTILFMHHPPFNSGFTVFDKIGLENAQAFGEVVARHSQIQRIVAGHAHWAMLRQFYGTIAMTCPSSTSSLIPDFRRPDQLAIVAQAPASLLHVWSQNAGLVTYTSLIGNDPAPQLIHDGQSWVS